MTVKEQRTLRRLVIRDTRKVAPFNEEARELRILNKRLWLHQRDVLAAYTREEREIASIEAMPDDRVESIVYRDNLFFDQAFIDYFLQRARRLGKACRVAFSPNDLGHQDACAAAPERHSRGEGFHGRRTVCRRFVVLSVRA